VLLSDRDLKAAIAAGRLGLSPFDEAMIQPSSIDVRLDRYFRVFANHRYTHIDPSEQQDDLTVPVEPDGDDPFILHPGEFVLGSTLEVISLGDDLASRLEGKALALDTEVPTPWGWTTMEHLEVGDEVFGSDGRPTKVVATTQPMLDRSCYEVLLSDGSSFLADAKHQWVTYTKAERIRAKRTGQAPTSKTTEELAATLRTSNGKEWNHHIPLAGAVQYAERELDIDPYVFGIWLGDGTTARGLGVLGDKHVTIDYLTGSVEQRLALLQGLMDSDGYADEIGRCEFVSIQPQLADAVHELAASLGMRPVLRKKQVTLNGIDMGVAYQVKFTPHLPVFRLERKLARLAPKRRQSLFRAVVAVRPVPSVAVRCIEVEAADGVFLVGRAFVPTHNSSLGRLGLLTHSTAGFIDPGFSGHVTLELSNVANLPIKLYPGMKIGQICVLQLSSPSEHPYGSSIYGSRYQDQRGPTPSRSYLRFSRAETQTG
jgi:deoxycytidine triphosphate deaminase